MNIKSFNEFYLEVLRLIMHIESTYFVWHDSFCLFFSTIFAKMLLNFYYHSYLMANIVFFSVRQKFDGQLKRPNKSKIYIYIYVIGI